MAMTKKERAEIDAALDRARLLGALRWTTEVKPDVPPPTGTHPLTTGWTFNTHAARVDVACSSSISHATGRTDRTQSQRPLALYSTKLLALTAMRHKVEIECAKKLAEIDKSIEAERLSPVSGEIPK